MDKYLRCNTYIEKNSMSDEENGISKQIEDTKDIFLDKTMPILFSYRLLVCVLDY